MRAIIYNPNADSEFILNQVQEFVQNDGAHVHSEPDSESARKQEQNNLRRWQLVPECVLKEKL